MKLPEDDNERKTIDLTAQWKLFPKATVALASHIKTGADKYCGGIIKWDRSKSPDELGSLLRHAFEWGTADDMPVEHAKAIAWRAMALLEKTIEAEGDMDSLVHGREQEPTYVMPTYDKPNWGGLKRVEETEPQKVEAGLGMPEVDALTQPGEHEEVVDGSIFIPADLYMFLESEGCFDEYVAEHDDFCAEWFERKDRDEWTDDAFHWDESPSGHNFWQDIYAKWLDHLDNMNKEEG